LKKLFLGYGAVGCGKLLLGGWFILGIVVIGVLFCLGYLVAFSG